jgi:hypothetical protein
MSFYVTVMSFYVQKMFTIFYGMLSPCDKTLSLVGMNDWPTIPHLPYLICICSKTIYI